MVSPSNSEVALASLNSLAMIGGGYRVRADGELVYAGHRPGTDWHAHGWFGRWLWILVDGALERRRLHKRRWQHVATGKTCHSRPADELGAMWFSAVIVALKLWPWIHGDAGLHNVTEVSHALDDHGCSRSRQRWLRRTLPFALKIQHRIRRAVIERCEPRPIEKLFPRGLSPPERDQRRWREPRSVATLNRALTMLFVGAIELGIPTSALLAEARRR